MAAFYLEQFLDSLEHLPIELQRNFTLMRELDCRSQELLRAIDKAADDLLHHFASDKDKISNEERKESVANIQGQYVKVKEYADDKVQLAIQTYELVDKHIRRLDSDLARFESEILERSDKQTEQTQTNVKKKSQVTTGIGSAGRKKLIQDKELNKKKKKKSVVSSPSQEANISNKKKKKSLVGSQNENDKTDKDDDEIIDMPVDPNEPTYCFCQQVSYGQMIGCDYPDCPIEWFHFACVKLTTKPKGKWFCPKCIDDKKKK